MEGPGLCREISPIKEESAANKIFTQGELYPLVNVPIFQAIQHGGTL